MCIIKSRIDFFAYTVWFTSDLTFTCSLAALHSLTPALRVQCILSLFNHPHFTPSHCYHVYIVVNHSLFTSPHWHCEYNGFTLLLTPHILTLPLCIYCWLSAISSTLLRTFIFIKLSVTPLTPLEVQVVNLCCLLLAHKYLASTLYHLTRHIPHSFIPANKEWMSWVIGTHATLIYERHINQRRWMVRISRFSLVTLVLFVFSWVAWKKNQFAKIVKTALTVRRPLTSPDTLSLSVWWGCKNKRACFSIGITSLFFSVVKVNSQTSGFWSVIAETESEAFPITKQGISAG